MVCEKVIGKLKDVDIAGKTVEYVDIEWHEAFKKIHRKVTGQGREVGIRMDDSILTRGLFQDDVIYDADGVVIVVNTPPCEVIEVSLAPGHEKYVLKNINLTIEAGSKLAVVGINGAGKTTLTKLLMRLYEPTEGRILLNGVDVKKYDRDTYFKIFAPVFQNIEIFAFPVWQNISMKPENETDKNRTMEALERSGLDEKINKYENKIDTMLLRIFDPNGVDLSGGERQRLAMARALYQNREVLVLDEPTAALDALAEDRMYQEFNQMVKGKTAIFISHRLSSTRFCDKIVMFEDGRIIEEGTHEQLINANGKYRNMFQVQAQYYKDKEGEVC
mgnify:FL=1